MVKYVLIEKTSFPPKMLLPPYLHVFIYYVKSIIIIPLIEKAVKVIVTHAEKPDGT